LEKVAEAAFPDLLPLVFLEADKSVASPARAASQSAR
jgi:hypothetical protein